MTVLVLASASQARAQMLKAAGVPIEIVPAGVDEDAAKESLLASGIAHRDIADRLAERKAAHVSAQMPGRLVLGADQILVFDGALISKSSSLEEARQLLRALCGRQHELVSAAVLSKDGVPVWRQVSRATLWMRNFSEQFLDDYLAGEGQTLLSGVGCYRLEGRGVQLFERIDGDHFTVRGLPLLPLLTPLRAWGILPS